jgi:uncharacterized protein (TIGR03083 family)
MASEPKALIDSWEAAFQAKRELIATLDTDKLDRPTDNPGWTVRNLATHLAVGADGLTGMAAPRLSAGKSLLPVPLPISLFRMIGNFSNGRDAKKYAKATPADLVKAMDAAHAKAATALAAVASGGWDRRGIIPTMGHLTLAEFVEQIVAHDREHAAVLAKALV